MVHIPLGFFRGDVQFYTLCLRVSLRFYSPTPDRLPSHLGYRDKGYCDVGMKAKEDLTSTRRIGVQHSRGTERGSLREKMDFYLTYSKSFSLVEVGWLGEGVLNIDTRLLGPTVPYS